MTEQQITDDQIKMELHNAGIKSTPAYEKLVDIVRNGVSTVNLFGWDYWIDRSIAGRKVKEIVKRLSSK